MARVYFCQQCEANGRITPLPDAAEANQKYCAACAHDRIRAAKAAYMRALRSRQHGG